MPDTNIYSEYSVIFSSGFYRATRIMHSADYAVARCLSVRPSVRLSHAAILSKRLYISSKLFHHRVPHHSSFSIPNKRNGNITTGTPLTGTSNVNGVWNKNLAIANRSHVSYAHNTLMSSIGIN